MPEKKVKVHMADGDKKKYMVKSAERENILVSDVSRQSCSRQEPRAVMKKLGLQCLAGQIIQTVHDRQAEE